MENPNNERRGLESERLVVADKRRRNGDLVGALSVLTNLYEDGVKNPEISAGIAAVYFDMELYEKSVEFWFRYLAVTEAAKAKMRAYSAISACFCMLGDTRAMAVYSEMEFSLNPKSEQEYDKVLMDYYDYVCDSLGSGYYVSYPEKYIPAKRLMFEADGLIGDGEDGDAVERLKNVQKDSEYYCEARSKMARCLLSQGKDDEADALLSELIGDFPDDPFANMSYAFRLLDKKRDTEARYHFLKAAKGEFFDEEDYLRVAFSLCRLGEDESALYPVEQALDINEYYLNGIYLYGLINYNRGNFDVAKRYFKKLYDLNRNDISLYLLKLADTREVEFLDYTFNAPTKRLLEKGKDIRRIAEGDEGFLKTYGEDALIDLIDWAIYYKVELQCEFFARITYASTSKVRGAGLRKMLTNDMANETKLAVIEELVMHDYNKKISFSIDANFVKVQLVRGDFDEGRSMIFKRAFAFACARICALESNLRSVRDAAYKTFDKLCDNGNIKKIADYHALGCVIAMQSGFKIKNKQIYTLFFRTEEKEVYRILELLNDNGE